MNLIKVLKAHWSWSKYNAGNDVQEAIFTGGFARSWDENGYPTKVTKAPLWYLKSGFYLWWRSVVNAVFISGWYLVMGAICRSVGHAYVDAGSYATPESGSDHLRCTRCGQDWSRHQRAHTLQRLASTPEGRTYINQQFHMEPKP